MSVPYLQFAGDDPPERIKIKSYKFTLGRSPDNDLLLRDHRASRFHAQILKTMDGDWILRDLSSANGTKLNSLPISESPLHPGDIIQIGATQLQFLIPESHPNSPPTPPKSPPTSPKSTATESQLSATQRQLASNPVQILPNSPSQDPEDHLFQLAKKLNPTTFPFDVIILNADEVISLPPPIDKQSTMHGGEPQLLLRLILLIADAAQAQAIEIAPTAISLKNQQQSTTLCTLDPTLSDLLRKMVNSLTNPASKPKIAPEQSHFSARFLTHQRQYQVTYTPKSLTIHTLTTTPT